MNMVDAVDLALARGLSFAAWRLPDAGVAKLAIQRDDRVEAVEDLDALIERGGFVVAPFRPDAKQGRFAIRPDILVEGEADAEQTAAILSLAGGKGEGGAETRPAGRDETFAVGRDTYLDQALRVIAAIRSGDFDKVVLSRVKEVPGDYRPRLAEIFDRLCKAYPGAFVYLFKADGQCWVGATPEALLCSKGENLFTVSLAGTRPYSEADLDLARWNGKERAEQDYVTRQIEGILKDFRVEGVAKKGPYARRAGALLHLCSEFSFPYRLIAPRLGAFVDSLHPTSAVCGIPKKGAMDLIAAVERHDRGLYAGYVGPVDRRNGVQLFVNLRCMRVLPDRLALFVGGGITAQSVPEDEWEETEMKSGTLLSILEEIS